MRQSIRSKMIAWIALPTLLIYLLVAIGALLFLRRVEESYARTRMTQLAANYARQFDLLLRESAMIADTSARLLEIEPQPAEEKIYELLSSNVNNGRYVYGSACAFEPGTYKTDDSLYSPYVYRGADGLQRMDIDRSVYDWYSDPAWQWFRRPKERGAGTWTDPYFDEGAGNVLMTTYSAPFFRDGAFRGVITVDIQLPQLQQTLGRAIAPDLDFVILTGDGHFVYSPETHRIMTQTIDDALKEFGRPALTQVVQRALAGGVAGAVDVDGWDTPQRQWLFYAPIPSTGWMFLSRLPESVVLKEAQRKAMLLGGALATTLCLMLLAIYFVSRRITAPIARLNDKVLEIAHGDLNARVQQTAGGDEVAELGRTFNKMADDLQVHIKRVAEQEAARQRIDHELDLARDIQTRLLPQTPPKIDGYDIAGWNRPAEQTGGDYFDWQPVSGGRLVVSIADATGHGIAPALVTAVCRAYARASFPTGQALEQLVGRINDLLIEDLQSERFVTFAVAVLDPRTHEVQLLSAGHGPMFFRHAHDGRIESLDSHGLPLAVAPSAQYGPVQVLAMQPGDILFLVTDGFFEWIGHDEKQFGIERLTAILRAASMLSAAEIIQTAYEAVLKHAGGTPQQDDLTAVVIRRLR